MKKKVIIFISIIAIIILSLTVYLKFNNQSRPTVRKNFNKKITNVYKPDGEIGKELGLKGVSAMAAVNDKILVLDAGNDRLLLIDNNGKLIKQIGHSGIEKGLFEGPDGMTLDEKNNIYIADSGNSRVEVFDSDGNFIKKINVDFFSNNTRTSMHDIEVDKKGNIYIATYALDKKTPSVLVVSKNNKITKVGKKMAGVLGKADEKVYFASEYEYFEEKKDHGLQTGTTYLMNMGTGKFTNKIELPYSYAPSEICFHNGYMYMYSRGYKTIDKYDKSGNYIETVYQRDLNEKNDLSAMTIDKSGNIYLYDYTSNVIKKFVLR